MAGQRRKHARHAPEIKFASLGRIGGQAPALALSCRAALPYLSQYIPYEVLLHPPIEQIQDERQDR